MASNQTRADAAPQPDDAYLQLLEREYAKAEFYKTYDLMTGVRIAATLGGFFGIMVLFVIYKSKCKSRTLSEENLEGVVAGLNRNGPNRRNLSLAGNTCWLNLPPANQFSPLDTPSTPPALQVIQATPELTPCGSRTSVYNGSWQRGNLDVPRTAPLASLSSFGVGSTDRDEHSVGSDSVFLDEELIDTEDEVEGFSTDSDVEKGDLRGLDGSSTAETRRNSRRYSSPNPYPLDREDGHQGSEDKSSGWRRLSASCKHRLPLPSSLSLNRETLF